MPQKAGRSFPQKTSAPSTRVSKEYGSVEWDSTILSVEGDVVLGARELLRTAAQLAGGPSRKVERADAMSAIGEANSDLSTWCPWF